MEIDKKYISEFKNVIEEIVSSQIKKEGITKYVSAIVQNVDENGSIDVYIPPNMQDKITGLLNKTGEVISIGDSVELCAKNGYLNNAWVAIKHKTNNSGGGGTGTGDKTFVYSQTVPSAIWAINHNLDKYPSVTVVDSAGTVVIGDIEYNSKDSLTITFSGAFSGSAYMN